MAENTARAVEDGHYLSAKYIDLISRDDAPEESAEEIVEFVKKKLSGEEG